MKNKVLLNNSTTRWLINVNSSITIIEAVVSCDEASTWYNPKGITTIFEDVTANNIATGCTNPDTVSSTVYTAILDITVKDRITFDSVLYDIVSVIKPSNRFMRIEIKRNAEES